MACWEGIFLAEILCMVWLVGKVSLIFGRNDLYSMACCWEGIILAEILCMVWLVGKVSFWQKSFVWYGLLGRYHYGRNVSMVWLV